MVANVLGVRCKEGRERGPRSINQEISCMSEVILGEDLKTVCTIGQAGIATAKPYYANWLAGASQLAPAVRLEPRSSELDLGFTEKRPLHGGSLAVASAVAR